MIDSKRPRRKESAGPFLRVGAVSYLNSKPLIEGLAERLLNGELVLDYPSRLADELAAAIDAGAWKDGDRLPTESQLEREHGLARGTVRQVCE